MVWVQDNDWCMMHISSISSCDTSQAQHLQYVHIVYNVNEKEMAGIEINKSRDVGIEKNLSILGASSIVSERRTWQLTNMAEK